MALSLYKVARLKPEIRLAQALSEYEAILADEQKAKLRGYRAQSPPSAVDVMRLTAEIDQSAMRNRKSRQCVGPRLSNVLQAAQQFAAVVDIAVGGSQSPIASGIWGVLKLSLQVASAFSAHFDQLSTLFMNIGRSCPRNQEYKSLYPLSQRLQEALCEYFIVIVDLCKHTVQFLNKSFLSQLSVSVRKPFESDFGHFQQELDRLANLIREEASLASKQAQQQEAKENSKHRALAARSSKQHVEWRRQKIMLEFLDACSTYDHRTAWKQARKKGHTSWLYHENVYQNWKQETSSGTFWCTGKLGSGTSVLAANVVDDLVLNAPGAIVAYFFCRHDDRVSLVTRSVVGSIARQILECLKLNMATMVAGIRNFLDTDQILDILLAVLSSCPGSNPNRYIIVLDGLHECEEEVTESLLKCLRQLTSSGLVFQVFCTSHPDVFRWGSLILEPRWTISMANSERTGEMADYIDKVLTERLEAGSLCLGDETIILNIRDALLAKAHGMFLWVVFQIDAICSQQTDQEVLGALEELPPDLPGTFDRILQGLQRSTEVVSNMSRTMMVFQFVAAAQRPLTLDELREVVSVEPAKTNWDPKNDVNDIRKLLRCCGSLVFIDEEFLTVHFTHHSVQQYLCSDFKKRSLGEYLIDMTLASLNLGEICVTYLNYEHFEGQLTSTNTTLPNTSSKPQLSASSSILKESIPQTSIAGKLAVRFLKARPYVKHDIHAPKEISIDIEPVYVDQPRQPHAFLSYAQDYWLLHTQSCTDTSWQAGHLWRRLISGTVHTVQLPWTPEVFSDLGVTFIDWTLENQQWALLCEAIRQDAKTVGCFRSTLLPKLKRFEMDGGDMTQTVQDQILLAASQAYGLTTLTIICLASEADAATLVCLAPQEAPQNEKELAIMSRLIDIGVDLNAPDPLEGALPLVTASRNRKEDIIRLLLKNGADVNATRTDKLSALLEACHAGYETIVSLLVEKGANVNAEGGYFATALQTASYNGHEAIVKLLLEKGANINAEGGYYGTALEAASLKGHEVLVKLLLEKGANANAEGGTALRVASLEGHEVLAKLLLEKGANANAEGGHHGTALHAASQRAHRGIVKLLLENGADINLRGGEYSTALHAAVTQANIEIVKLLLKNGADVNLRGGRYGTALHAAVTQANIEIVRLLLGNGADVNLQGGRYGTALQTAVTQANIKIARLLLENGADVDLRGGEHGTALMAAAWHGNEGIVRLLLENGADINAQGGLYGSALQVAAHQGNVETVRLLLENGADINAEGGLYESAFLAACAYRTSSRIPTLKILLQAGANVNARNGGALRIARLQDDGDLERLLLKYGAEDG